MIDKTLTIILLLLLSFITISNSSFGQSTYDPLILTRGELKTKLTIVTPATADHALRISNYIFNSKEFQDSIAKRDFNYQNMCKGCDANKETGKPRITGKEVLDKLFERSQVSLTLILLKVGKPPVFGKCFGLGFTCPKTDTITSYYKNINCDMSRELPFEYAYAVHLCHEYMHDIGYCHTDHVDDIAEATGWIAFHFMDKWYREGRRIP